ARASRECDTAKCAACTCGVQERISRRTSVIGGSGRSRDREPRSGAGSRHRNNPAKVWIAASRGIIQKGARMSEFDAYTMGFSIRTWDETVALLQSCGIQQLVDIRTL